MRPTALRAWPVLLALALAGCGGGGGGGGGADTPAETPSNLPAGVTYQLAPGVVEIPANGAVTVGAVDQTSLVLSGAVPALRAGQVLVGTEGNGFLRRVVSSTTSGGTTTVQTTDATLEDVFQEAAINWQGAVDEFASVTPSEGVTVVETGLASSASEVLPEAAEWSGDLAYLKLAVNRELASNEHGTLELFGTITVAIPLEFYLDVGALRLRRLYGTVGVVADGNLRVRGNYRAELWEYQRDIELASFVGSPIAVGPVVIVPEGTISTRVDGGLEVEAGLEVSARAAVEYRAGPEWVRNVGWSLRRQPADLSRALTFTSTQSFSGSVTGHLEITAPLVHGALKLYGVAGPYADLGAGLRADLTAEASLSQLTPTGTVSVDCNLFASIRPGAEVSILGYELASWRGSEYRYTRHLAGFPLTHDIFGAEPPPIEEDGYVIGGDVIQDPDDPTKVIVTLNAIVDPATGVPLEGLTPDNFHVYEYPHPHGAADVGLRRAVVSAEPVGTAGGAVDLCFLIDTTGSMDGEIGGVVDSVNAFAANLAARGIDLRLSGVAFRDSVEEVFPFTSSVAAFRNWVSSLRAEGGGDTPENMLDAVAAVTELGWRAGCHRIMVALTDAPMHQAGDGTNYTSRTAEDVARMLQGSYTLHAVSPGELTTSTVVLCADTLQRPARPRASSPRKAAPRSAAVRPAGSADSPTRLLPGAGATRASLAAGGQEYFHFQAEPLHHYAIYTSGNEFDTVMHLYHNGSLVASDDDSGDGNASRITMVATAAGRYDITVSGYYASSSGSFHIQVQDLGISREPVDARYLSSATGGVWSRMPADGRIDLTTLPLSSAIYQGYRVRFQSVPTNADHDVRLVLYVSGEAVADQFFQARY